MSLSVSREEFGEVPAEEVVQKLMQAANPNPNPNPSPGHNPSHSPNLARLTRTLTRTLTMQAGEGSSLAEILGVHREKIRHIGKEPATETVTDAPTLPERLVAARQAREAALAELKELKNRKPFHKSQVPPRAL